MTIGPLIDDNTYSSFIDRNNGYQGMIEPGVELSYGSFGDLGIPLIPTDQWDDIIREQEKEKATIRDMVIEMALPAKSQGNLPYCWVFAPTHCCEIIRLMETGQTVSYSPASCGAPVKNFRRVGGWGSQALERMKTEGINESSDWPDTTVSRAYFTEENKKLAKLNLALEYVTLTSWEERASCILAGIPTADGYPWWSHEVTGTGIVIGSHDLIIRNSWGAKWGDGYGFATLSGRKKLAGDSVAIMAMKPR